MPGGIDVGTTGRETAQARQAALYLPWLLNSGHLGRSLGYFTQLTLHLGVSTSFLFIYRPQTALSSYRGAIFIVANGHKIEYTRCLSTYKTIDTTLT